MSGQPAEIRDILAVAMRRERYGYGQAVWPDLQQRSDHLIRLLEAAGVRLVRAGDPEPDAPTHTSPVVYSFPMVGRGTRRLVRRGSGDLWEVVAVADCAETVEQAFSLQQASINGGMVLTGDPAARSIPGLGTQLAACLEIFRMDAAAMGPVG